MIKKILSLFFLLAFFQGLSQSIQLSENTKVSILTIGTAEQSYALYGHTAIRFKDISNQMDVVFNYGSFDFDTEYFMLKFVKGDLQYFVSSSSYADFEYNYRYENRSIYEQDLNLTQVQKQELFTHINSSLYSDERFYTYKFIDRNCTTMIIDKVNEILPEKAIQFQRPVEESYRSILFPYANDHFYQQFGINIIFGSKVDQKGTKLFLPLDLMHELKATTVQGKPLISETKTVFEASAKSKPVSYIDSIYSLIFFLLVLILINNSRLNLVYFSILGLLGVFFCGVGLYSFHEELLWNYNALLFNPFYLVYVFFYAKKNTTKFLRLKWFLLLMLGIYLIVMLNKVHLVSVLPLMLTNLILLFRTKLKSN